MNKEIQNEQELEKASEDKNGIVTWIKAHKKQLVFIGISIRIERLDWLVWGAVITAILFAARIIVVKLVVARNTPVLDKAVMSTMIPKGLGAAVIATLPLRQEHPDGLIIRSICFAVILFSTIYCSVLFFLLKTGVTMPIYSVFYGQSSEPSDG